MPDDFETYSIGNEDYVYLSFDSIVKQTMRAIIFDMGDFTQGIPVAHIDMEKFDPENDSNVPVKFWFAKNNGLI